MRQIFTLAILLTVCSCSNLNQVKTDGGRNLNGKVVDILYVETDKGVEKIKNKLIKELGQPTATTENELAWDLNSNNQINNDPMTMTVHLDSTFHYEGQNRVFDFINIDFCLTDKKGNDLLTNDKIKRKGQEFFQQLFDDID
jgi:hypothetical protein